MRPEIRVVIGKNFGDEGKGLAVDHLTAKCHGKTLVIRHNGGAQSGHTVEIGSEDRMKRFVFHELSSGSFRRADTFWAETFFPDLYKLGEELESFRKTAGFAPQIFCDTKATPVLLDDVLQNMLLELSRGSNRHGSCGMGINEAFLRKEAGYGITFGEICQMEPEDLADRLFEIRAEYGKIRVAEILQETGLSLETLKEWKAAEPLKGWKAEEPDSGNDFQEEEIDRILEYLDLLEEEDLIRNEARLMKLHAACVDPVTDVLGLFRGYDQVIFETGQGLLLDAEYLSFAPHLTSSRTGLTNPMKLLSSLGLTPDEVVYVTRSYVTRHGAGPLPRQMTREALGITETDQTNLPNDWQGQIRYAAHGTMEEFLAPVLQDLQGSEEPNIRPAKNVSLFVTHLNETRGMILMSQEKGGFEAEPMLRFVTPEALMQEKRFRSVFTGTYLSDGKDQDHTKYREIN